MAVYAGKVVIVTGASQGIGKALSLALAPQRPRLVLAARDTEALARVARDQARADGDRTGLAAQGGRADERRGVRPPDRGRGLAFPSLVDHLAAKAVRKGR